jgi:hypothetical protein
MKAGALLVWSIAGDGSTTVGGMKIGALLLI